MSKKLAKLERILDMALELLKTEGDFGVTMRKVATLCDMSLSNLQYYFKTKDELLKAMADRYFQRCLIEMKEMPAVTCESEVETLVRGFLAHGHEMSEMCRIFREYWAVSTRNLVIQDYLQEYYTSYCSVVSDKLQPISSSEKGLSQAVSVFVPYVEGYSITAASLSEGLDSTCKLLSTIMCQCLKG